MRLTKLEMHGFKSFFHQTALSFSPGISAVVGPNGCGKSNIADAIRWVMGEQSPKRLRGRSMDDIIFAGTAANRSMGFAEVSLSVSRTNGPFPSPFHHYDDLTVTRRLYRSGESEYLINRVPCRLKDIVGLFMDTGLGARGYAIIEQGSISRIIDSGPEERRAWVEEAAGIVKFKAQRLAALRKMEQTVHNLDRVADVLEEVSRQARSLKRQAGKAKKYREFRARLQELELALAAWEFDQSVAQVSHLDKELRAAQDRRDILTAREAAVGAALEADRLRASEQEAALNNRREERHKLGGRIQALEKTEEHLKDKRRDIDIREARATERLAEEENRLQELAEERDGLNEKSAGLKGQVESLTGQRDELSGRLDEIREVEEAKSAAASKFKDELIELASDRAQAHNAALTAGERLASLDARRDRLVEQAEQAEGQRDEMAAALKAEQSSLEDVDARLDEMAEQLEQLGFEAEDAAEATLKLRRERDESAHEMNRISSRLEGLKALAESYEGVDEGVKALLFGPEISGLVAEGIRAPERLEIAVDAALSGAAQHLVAVDGRAALEKARLLAQGKGGRAGLLAADLLRPGQNAPAPPGMKLLAGELKFSGPAGDIARRLIGGCLLAEDLDQALKLWNAAGRERAVVTPGGEFIAPPGVILAGRAKDSAAPLLARQRMIRELETDKAGLGEQLAARQAELSRAEEHQAELDSQINELTAVCRQDESLKVEADKQVSGLKIRLTELDRRAAVLREEVEGLREEETGFKQEREAQSRLVTELDGQKGRLEESLTLAQSEAAAASSQAAELREELTGVRVALTRLTGQQDQFREAARRIEEDRKRTITAIERLKGDLTGADRERTELHHQAVHTEEELKLLTRQVTAAEQSITREQERLSLVQEELRERSDQARTLREDLKGAEQAVGQAEVVLSKARFRQERVVEDIQRRYKVNLSEDHGQYLDLEMDRRAAADEVESLEVRIQRLGPVNPTAVEEYQALVERQEFLEKEVQDLTSSMNDLKSAIRKINKTTLERFSETFKSVAGKMEYLGPILFGKGAKVQMVLNDPDDPLDSGIDLKIQPPGKRLTSMGLLSGGEKALSAATLLFAIFLHKPSPFCLLDEVDAPLDESNVDRFSKLVKEIGRHSQILMITHNRRTMEMVDTLYGVTMPEPGVSRMVSVKLEGEEGLEESAADGLV